MPSVKEIVDDKIRRLESVPDEFLTVVQKSQLEAYKEVQKMVLDMDTENGILIISDKNTSIINSIETTIKNTVFNDEYSSGLTEYIKQFNVQAELTNKYFVELNVGFDSEANEVNTVLASQKNAINLLGEDSFTQSFITPLNQLINTSMTTGATMSDTIDSLQQFVLGSDELDGKMVGQAKRIAYDIFAVADRNQTAAIANSLGLEFYLFQGGHLSDSREFCDERKGKYFHKKEIEAWGEGKKCCGLKWPQSGKWQGMNPQTNKNTIFALVGGFNCKDSLNPVSIKSVPKDVIQRNIENGNYKP